MPSVSVGDTVNVGDIIKIWNMAGEPNYKGRVGIVKHIDDRGQLHGTWGGCAVIIGIDHIEVIKEK